MTRSSQQSREVGAATWDAAASGAPAEEKPATADTVTIGVGPRLLQLDILRGFAVLSVLAFHSPATRGASGVLRPIDALIHRFGWSGVDLFFVLSGFLIGGLLFTEIKKHGRLDVGRFLIRRALRIWPPYYVMLVYLFDNLTADPAVGLHKAWTSLWPGLVHIQNFILLPRDHLWSLAVEEHFYLLLPLFLWFLLRNGKQEALRVLPAAFAVIGLSCLVLRWFLLARWHVADRWPTYFCIDALFAGVTAAYLNTYRPELLLALTKRRASLIAGFALLTMALLKVSTLQTVFGFTAVYLGYTLLLVHFVRITPGNGLVGRWLESRSARLLAAIGVSSYSIYLWHRDFGWWGYTRAQAVAGALHLPGAAAWALNASCYVAAGVVGGVMLERLVAEPVQELRARVFPSRVSSEAEQARPVSTSEVSVRLAP